MSDSPSTLGDATASLLELRGQLLAETGTGRATLDRVAGRVLAESVVAAADRPSRSEATMDGFAVAAGDDGLRPLADGRTEPGSEPPALEPGTARRVTTGAPLPGGADAVVPVEAATVTDGRVRVEGAVPAGQHVLARGSVVEAGETVLDAGRRLAPRDAAVLRDLGHDEVTVRERLSAAVLATGTEIHEGREPDRDSETLANLLRSWGARATLAGSVPDDPGRVGERVADLAADHDAVVTTGGTGASAIDETGGVLADRAAVRVAGVALRPGSGTTVAWLAETGTVLVALPGPPGAAFASATLLARPLFVGARARATVTATVACDLAVPDRAVRFVVPVEFAPAGSGGAPAVGGERVDAFVTGAGDPPSVVPFGHPDSSVRLYGERYRPHRVASCARLSAADGFLVADADLAAGQSVAVVPYEVVET